MLDQIVEQRLPLGDVEPSESGRAADLVKELDQADPQRGVVTPVTAEGVAQDDRDPVTLELLELDAGDPDLATEGAIAKLLATEAGNQAADAAIQAFGGYGYVREYEVEKIRRDVRITMIYEGTSEILQGLIALTRWRQSLQSKGRLYLELADELEALDRTAAVGGAAAATAARVLARLLGEARRQRLTRQQFLQFQLADAFTQVEAAVALARKASRPGANADLQARSRLFAREVGRVVVDRALIVLSGGADERDPSLADLALSHELSQLFTAQAGAVADMDRVARSLKET